MRRGIAHEFHQSDELTVGRFWFLQRGCGIGLPFRLFAHTATPTLKPQASCRAPRRLVFINERPESLAATPK